MKLLLNCARTRLDKTTAARIRELACGEIDWPGLRALADRHRVMPLLYRSLYTTCPELVPEDVLGDLRQDYQANAARNMLMKRELLNILVWFDAQGVRAIPFKGPILADQAYGDLALRSSSDLDLLVRVQDVPAANALLQSKGFQPEYRLDKFEYDVNLQGPGSCHFEGETNIDLHWEIAPRTFTYDFDPEGYWSRLQPISFDPMEVLVLSMGDRLLMLCGHGVRNAWSQLVEVCDIAETIPHIAPEEWYEVIDRASTLGTASILRLGVTLAQELINADLPENIQDNLRCDAYLNRLSPEVRARLLDDTDTAFSGPEWLRFQMRGRRHFSEKVRFLWALATTPNVDDLTMRQLPSWLSSFYLIHRAVRLMGKYMHSPRIYSRQKHTI